MSISFDQYICVKTGDGCQWKNNMAQGNVVIRDILNSTFQKQELTTNNKCS